MHNNQERLEFLFHRNAIHRCTGDELAELYRLVAAMEEGEVNLCMDRLFEQQPDSWERDADEVDWDGMFRRVVLSRTRVVGMPSRRRGYRWYVGVAAVVFVVACAGLLVYLLRSSPEKEDTGVAAVVHDRAPGYRHAVLTLADGTQVPLDSTAAGMLAMQGNTRLQASGNGVVEYQAQEKVKDVSLYNKLITPRGGQYRLVLPDGSRVWLNAASSIHYPVSFGPHERKVSVTGEVYFEVEKDPASPFIVQVNDQVAVRVLGTHFNVHAYADEPVITTTLLEGSVMLQHQAAQALLRPGQQARIQFVQGNTVKMPLIEVGDTDATMAVAWTNSMFQFKRTPVKTIMRDIARWYDVTVDYEGLAEDHYVTGFISRNIPLSQVLKMLAFTNDLEFKQEKDRVIVFRKR